MFQVRLYERVPKDDGEVGWRRIGQMQHPAQEVAGVVGTVATALTKMGKDAARVERVIVERLPEAAQGLTLAPPKKAKK